MDDTEPTTRPEGVEQRVLRERFQLTRKIGHGGMGSVYAANDLKLKRVVAIKELRREYTQDELLRRRFEREAEAAGGLGTHPHIVTVYDWFDEGETLFIVMEYLAGGTLLDRMSQAPGGRMEAAFVLEVGRQALLGLDAAHSAGLVHRDIKPGNLLFDGQGTVKLADFGVVRSQRDDSRTALTNAGGHPGTLVYMSPEQIDGAELEGRSDVYSLAAVLYECLAGVRYFERTGLRRTERALMDAICDVPPVPLRDHVPYVSPDIEALLERALAKNVFERPEARQMAEEIQAILGAPRLRPSIEVPGEAPRRSTRPHEPVEAARYDPHAETRARGQLESTEHLPFPGGQTQPRPATERVFVRALEERPESSTARVVPRVEPLPATGAPVLERREKDGTQVVRIPAGAFVMGGRVASDEQPIRQVELDGYTIDRVPVTVGRYRRFLEAIERDGPPVIPLIRRLFPGGKDHRPSAWDTDDYRELCPTDDHPVVYVDWFDAYAYAQWVGARLPSEAEWERAARGSQDERTYPWGDEPVDDDRAVFGRKTWGPEPVGARPLGASPEGVLDLAGNVWEWCLDRYDARAYDNLGPRNPLLQVSTSPTVKAVKRGGSWTNAPGSLRVSKRGFELLKTRAANLGFRCRGA